MEISKLFDLSYTLAEEFLKQFEYIWDALPKIKEFIIACGKSLNKEEFNQIKQFVWVHKSVKIASTAFIDSPCIVGAETEIRHCAFIRGSALIGKNCVVGNSTEVKNSILFDGVQIPHFNYVGDSIFGYKAHLGAGAITSNVKSDKSLVTVKEEITVVSTGLKKFGALVGDFVEVGCNSVLNPGTVIGKNSTIYPLSSVRGYVPQNSIYKNNGIVITKAPR